MADERGSIISVTNNRGSRPCGARARHEMGTVIAINAYDDYGIPASTNLGRFGYSGGLRPCGARARHDTQTWLPEIGMYYYKARMYSPTLGRFMQTDPIGYADGMNWYAYVGNDPINFVDPLGLAGAPPDEPGTQYYSIRDFGALGVRRERVRTCSSIDGLTDVCWEHDQYGIDPDMVILPIINELQSWRQAAVDLLCGIGNVGGGLAVEETVVGGFALSGRVAIDPARGRGSLAGQAGGTVGGLVSTPAPFVTRSTPYSGTASIIENSISSCSSVALVLSITGCSTVLGTDGDTGSAVSLGLAKVGASYQPFSDEIAIVTPSLWDIGC